MLKPGNISVLDGTLLEGPHSEVADVAVNDVIEPFITFDDVRFGYEDNHLFGLIVKALRDECLDN